MSPRADETYFEGPGGPASRIRFTSIAAAHGHTSAMLYALDQWGRVWILSEDSRKVWSWYRAPAPGSETAHT